MRLSPVRPIILALVSGSLLLFAACGPQATVQEKQPAQPAQKSWKVIGPGGGGGQFLPTINPEDPNNVFVRCDMTGAYVTLDGGESWRMFNLRTVVQDFEFDPQNPSTIYAANRGLYRSDDRGLRWSLIYPAPENVVAELMLGDHADEQYETKDGMPDAPVNKVRVDPANSEHILLGLAAPHHFLAARGLEYLADSTRILASSDKGKTWRQLARVPGRQVLAIFPGSWEGKSDEAIIVTDLTMARVSGTTGESACYPLPVNSVTAADGGHGSQGSIFYLLADLKKTGEAITGGVYRSTDLGKSWEQVNTGLVDELALKTGRLPSFRTFAVCEGNPEVAYLSCAAYAVKTGDKTERHFGIFKTGTGGDNWNWVYQADNERVIGDNHRGGWMKRLYGPEWGEYPLSLGVSPTDPDICYATDFGCTYRTLDGGVSWEQVYSKDLPDSSVTSRGLDVTTCYGVHFDPFDPEHIFISYTDIGAFHSFNGGRSWFHAIEGIPRPWINTCYWMAFDPEVKGRAWSVWGSGHDLPRPKMFRGGNFGRFVGGVAATEDGCRTWRQSNEGMPPNTVCTHILLDPDSPVDSRTLYVCGFGKGVFKSTDSGRSWKNMSSGVSPNLNAWRMALLPDGTLFLLVARGLEQGRTVDGALYRSDDKAETWKQVPLPEGANAPNDLAFDPSNPERMYLSLWPWPGADGKEHFGGLLRTEDGGKTWKRVFREDAHVYAAALNPSNPSTVFINTFDSAAFRSDDRGSTWYRLEGYNFKWGHRPIPDPHHPGMLYLTTFGGSVFYGPAAGVPGALEDIGNFRPEWRWGNYTGEGE
ncbi:MAG TPA: hypothetical protein VM123_07825 [archaeon]|nr:hypothetical protein [archaeon]